MVSSYGALADGLVAICFYVIERVFVLTAIVAQATLRVLSEKALPCNCVFPLGSGAGEIY